jgi:Protein of unknown function (DUF3443)
MPIRRIVLALSASAVVSSCVGNHNGIGGAVTGPQPVQNTTPLVVDAGPAGAGGAINHAYVTVTVCLPGSQTQCASIDHVLLDTGSSGLRLVRSVLAGHSLTLAAATDAAGKTIEECVSFTGGQTWGPVAAADISLAGESASKVPVQIMDDTGSGAPPPANCGANGTLINGVAGFNANGLLGVGVFAQDCGQACVAAATPLPIYYGCTAAGACTAENTALAAQVTNPVALFAADNNGVIVDLPNLTNANGDLSVQGNLIFGIATQGDNALPAAAPVVLETDTAGDFTAKYNGSNSALPALIDSGTDAYAFNDPSIAVCASGAFIGYYCPAVAPQSVYAVNMGSGANAATDTVDFAIADPNTFVAGATAFIDLAGGGGSVTFTWGMPFFYGRKIYVGIEQRPAGVYTGPYFAY